MQRVGHAGSPGATVAVAGIPAARLFSVTAIAVAAVVLVTVAPVSPAGADADDPVLSHPEEPRTSVPRALGGASEPGWWLDAVGAPEVRDDGTGAGTTVAVLDTAIDGEAAGVGPDRLHEPIEIIEDEEPSRHGTGAAALVAGRDHGACPGCEILPVTVLGADGRSRASHVAAGIDAAVEAGADVISLSLGGPLGSRRLEAAVTSARDAGVLVVAAAGNSGGTREFYPASYDGVLSIAGHDPDGGRYGWSTHGGWVSSAAPGCARLDLPRGGRFCGTSAAAPIAAGVAGLVRGAAPEGSPVEALEAITGSGDELDFVAHGTIDAPVARDAVADDEAAVDPLPDDPIDAAVELSRERFGRGEAEAALVARADVFADALAGSSLAREQPVLYATGDELPSRTRDELERVLGPGGTVQVLGGSSAVGDDVAHALREVAAEVERLAGDDRAETALAVADAAGARGEVFLARADEWADAIAVAGPAATHRTPVLLTAGDELDARVAEYLEAEGIKRATLLGGEQALDGAVADAVAEVTGREPTRIAGREREATAARVASTLVPRDGAGAIVIGGYEPSGWAVGLAAAPLAAARDLPILLTGPNGELGGVSTDELHSRGAASELHLRVAGPLAGPAGDTLRRLAGR
ncbi:hypothetical protein ER308_06575 [Egibacter rhizosphaerae]|uniref:Peptidase S8/S53 domain-containing protein n=1 Tax=Egibacter rhizosphaerae TaxID=1670831 RepID=A0A411YDH7_9ACTN|nr:S8 family serine peptidase [Egibacter rhizosphaerae]QBI19238.1 hypothetical protein ER308_06575 [Egibacter rhizosphaerae]